MFAAIFFSTFFIKFSLNNGQAVRDLETGALKKSSGQSSYVMDYDVREKISKIIDRVKHPTQYYLDLGDKLKELMELLTGHKLTKDEEYPYYTEEHVQYSEKHRIDILKSLTEEQVTILAHKLLITISAMSNIIDIIQQEKIIKPDE